MSVKKTISLSFLLLANVIMLAHSVVFHHHHDQTSAAVCALSQEHHCDENAEQQSCHHEHQSKNTHKCCVVENCNLDAPFTKANSFKQIKPTFNNLVFIVNNFSVNQITQITDLAGLPFRQKPHLSLFYADFVAQSIGLRAPPVC